ncbi:MAG: hypothetical protein LBB12_02430 [Holosporaceae bacterium]|jgi:hypothetical protein|nr:hypothetical protein [Holosporaceae bacterium]
MLKFIIGILAVIGVHFGVLADPTPETVIISTVPHVSVTVNKSDVNDDDANITISSASTCGNDVTYRFDISAINDGKDNYLQSRYLYLRPGKSSQEWATHLIGVYDKNDDVKYRLDVYKNDASVASVEISAKGIKKLSK